MKKKWGLLASIILTTVLLTACGEDKNENKKENQKNNKSKEIVSVGMVTDSGGVNDNSFNQISWQGLLNFSKKTGADVEFLQGKTEHDYLPNLEKFVKEGKDIIWTISWTMEESVGIMADKYPDVQFGSVDAIVDKPNVVSVTFKEEEVAFLAGVAAALNTKSHKIGFIGGEKIPSVENFEIGFIEGVKAVNPKAVITSLYADDFYSVEIGKKQAKNLYDSGADVVFHAAGYTGNGVFEEAMERYEKGEQVWVIGVDMDQSMFFGHEVTLTSAIKRVDVAIEDISGRILKGEKFNGPVILGLKEGAVGLPDNNPNISEEVHKVIEEYKQKIIDGEIMIERIN